MNCPIHAHSLNMRVLLDIIEKFIIFLISGYFLLKSKFKYVKTRILRAKYRRRQTNNFIFQ